MRIVAAEHFNLERRVEYGTPEQNETVLKILADIREEKDVALMRYSREFDGVEPNPLKVSIREIDAAYREVPPSYLSALRQAADNIRRYHEKQKRQSWMEFEEDGVMLGQLIRPLRRVGVYVPGGTAAYPSSLLMNVIPAQVAGVPEIAMATPPATRGKPGIDPYILVAAAEAGVKEIYRVGGAQAIGALAYGTESIPAVDKICGPGNIYVTLAKRYVYGVVDIDSIAGPTDIAVLADDSADPTYVAADLLSQAEHDEMATAVLVTPSTQLAEAVKREVERQLADLPRKDIAARSLEQNGAIITVRDLSEGIDVVNRLAPEHLELMVEAPLEAASRIENAGAIFLGPYSTEPVGDYFAGPNHILPTNGTARFSSPLGVDDFVKRSSLISYSREALFKNAEAIMELARHEGFEGHARAVRVRLDKEGKS